MDMTTGVIKIKHCLVENSFGNVWANPYQVNLKTFLLIFKQRLVDIFKQNWFESVSQSSILTTYVVFKSEHSIEKYLEILPRQFRT